MKIICLFGMVIANACYAPSAIQRSSQDSVIENSKTSTSVPFDLIDNRTFINVKLNGKSFRMMFDSGAGYIITPEVAKALKLKVEGAGQSRRRGRENSRNRLDPHRRYADRRLARQKSRVLRDLV